MRNLLTIIAILLSVSGSAQFYQPYYNSVDWSTDMYVNNSGKPAINAPKVSRAFDSSMRFHWYVKSMYFDTLRSNIPADPTSVDRIMWHRMSDGKLMFSLASGWYNKNQVDSGMSLRQTFADTSWDATKSWVNSRGFLTTFTEVDPTVPANVKAITSGDILNWNGKFNVPSGTTSQYLRGDGSLASFPSIPAAQVNSDWNAVSGVSQILNKPTLGTAASQNSSAFATAAQGALAQTALQTEVDGSITNEIQSLSISGRNLSLSNGGGSVTIPFPPFDSLVGKPAAPSFNNTPARSLNTSFQISTTRNTRVSYSITHTVALTLVLASGSTTAFLEISPNNSTWTEINRAGYSKTLAVAVSAGDGTTNNLVGEVPAGWWVRIRTAGTGGGLTSSVPNVVYNSGQEVQY